MVDRLVFFLPDETLWLSILSSIRPIQISVGEVRLELGVRVIISHFSFRHESLQDAHSVTV